MYGLLLVFLLAPPTQKKAVAKHPQHSSSAPRPPLDTAKLLFSDGLYADAIPILDDVLARADLTPGQRSEALFVLGSSHLALGHESAARARYAEILVADSDYALPANTPRKIAGLFEELRSEQKDRPTLTPLAPEATSSALGDGVRVRFGVERLHGRRAVAFWRLRGAADVKEVTLEGTTELSALLLLPATTGERSIEYFAELREGDHVVARAGSAAEPLRFSGAPLVTDKPIYKKAWFWSVLSVATVVVAGGAVAAYVATRPAPGPSTGSISVSFGGAR